MFLLAWVLFGITAVWVGRFLSHYCSLGMYRPPRIPAPPPPPRLMLPRMKGRHLPPMPPVKSPPPPSPPPPIARNSVIVAKRNPMTDGRTAFFDSYEMSAEELAQLGERVPLESLRELIADHLNQILHERLTMTYSAVDISDILGIVSVDVVLWDEWGFLPRDGSSTEAQDPGRRYTVRHVLLCAVLQKMTDLGVTRQEMQRVCEVVALLPFADLLFDPERHLEQGALWAVFVDGQLYQTSLAVDGVFTFRSQEARDKIANANSVHAINMTKLKKSVLYCVARHYARQT